jgi:hypothetical protein
VTIPTSPDRVAHDRGLTAGGTFGNERLTAATGVVLLVALTVVGLTIVRIGQLLDLHMFLGMALIGPVVLKLASTGYRFARYYTGDPLYRRKGPPVIGMRLIAPIVVLTTVIVFASGVVLLLAGPDSRHPWVMIHKVSFIVWVAFMAVHVLGHLADLPRALTTRSALLAHADARAGREGRALALGAAVLIGAMLGILSIAQFAPWAHHGH